MKSWIGAAAAAALLLAGSDAGASGPPPRVMKPALPEAAPVVVPAPQLTKFMLAGRVVSYMPPEGFCSASEEYTAQFISEFQAKAGMTVHLVIVRCEEMARMSPPSRYMIVGTPAPMLAADIGPRAVLLAEMAQMHRSGTLAKAVLGGAVKGQEQAEKDLTAKMGKPVDSDLSLQSRGVDANAAYITGLADFSIGGEKVSLFSGVAATGINRRMVAVYYFKAPYVGPEDMTAGLAFLKAQAAALVAGSL